MKKLFFIIMMALAAFPAYAADVGVSVSIGQPGFYGRIDIGNAPAPVLIYPKPLVIEPAPRQDSAPLYLRVPPGHAKNWKKHCAKYNACGRPVYFVRDKWYNDVYVPHYRSQQEGHGRGNHGSKEGRYQDVSGKGNRGHKQDHEQGGPGNRNDRPDREENGKREHHSPDRR